MGVARCIERDPFTKMLVLFVFFFVPFVILLFGRGAHREVTGFGQNVHGFRHLWIV